MLIHTGDEPYKYGTCGKSFSLKGSLIKHMHLHADDNPH